jgi:P pilus assembly chaperone PapD
MGVTRKRGGLVVKVNNRSDAHVRLSGMKIVDTEGRIFSFDDGLDGYVLSGASNSFSIATGETLKGSTITISVQSNFGPLIKITQLE